MPETLNEKIARERGWTPCKGMVGLWLPPDGSGVGQPVPLFDTDWTATGVLLEDCYYVHIAKMSDIDAAYTPWNVSVQLEFGAWSKSGKGKTAPAAIAAAWYAAKEAEQATGERDG